MGKSDSRFPKQALYQAEPRPAPRNSATFSDLAEPEQGAKSERNGPIAARFGRQDGHQVSALPDCSPALLPPLRSLEQYLDEASAEFRRLPLTHPRRPALALRIRAIEIELDARQPL